MLLAPDFAAFTDGTLFTLGLSRLEFVVAIVGLMILLLVDVIRYRKGMQLYEYLNTKWLWLRWSVYIFLVVAIFLFGIYGPGYNAAEFIYFQF